MKQEPLHLNFTLFSQLYYFFPLQTQCYPWKSLLLARLAVIGWHKGFGFANIQEQDLNRESATEGNKLDLSAFWLWIFPFKKLLQETDMITTWKKRRRKGEKSIQTEIQLILCLSFAAGRRRGFHWLISKNRFREEPSPGTYDHRSHLLSIVPQNLSTTVGILEHHRYVAQRYCLRQPLHNHQSVTLICIRLHVHRDKLSLNGQHRASAGGTRRKRELGTEKTIYLPEDVYVCTQISSVTAETLIDTNSTTSSYGHSPSSQQAALLFFPIVHTCTWPTGLCASNDVCWVGPLNLNKCNPPSVYAGSVGLWVDGGIEQENNLYQSLKCKCVYQV